MLLSEAGVQKQEGVGRYILVDPEALWALRRLKQVEMSGPVLLVIEEAEDGVAAVKLFLWVFPSCLAVAGATVEGRVSEKVLVTAEC